MRKDGFLGSVLHFLFLTEKWNENESFKTGSLQPLTGCSVVSNFWQKTNRHPSYQDTSLIWIIFSIIYSIINFFDLIFTAKFNAKTAKSTYQDDRSVENSFIAYYFKKYICYLISKNEKVTSTKWRQNALFEPQQIFRVWGDNRLWNVQRVVHTC